MTATVLLVGADLTVGRELSAAGYRVVDLRLVDEAVVAGAPRSDVVVVYVHGGDRAAAATCRRLRSHPPTATARILVVGAGEDLSPAEVLTAGADAILPQAAPGVVLAQVQALLRGCEDERLRELLATAELRSAELTAVIESMPDAVYMGTRAGITHCNSNALRMLGAKSMEELQQRIGELGRRFAVRWPDSGRLLQEHEMQFTRALNGETVAEEVLATNAADGTDVFIRSACAPIVQDGAIVGAVAINSDITAQKRAEEALREADRHKDEFIAILSHELRNPLAAIRYALPALQQRAVDAAAIRSVDVIDRQLDQMTRILDDLLDIARISRGDIVLRCQPVALDSVVTEASDAASPAIAAGRHTLDVDVAAETIWLDADRARLTQVVTNLLTNAAKYTPRGGRIRLEAGREGLQAIIRVRDNGVGIPPESLSSVFEMFHQAHRGPRPMHHGGLGIGLTIAKRLVELHGGSIASHSDGVGRGSEFVVRLPAMKPAEAAPATERSGPPPVSTRRLKVLIIEDNADLADMLGIVVESFGHEVRKALDGSTGLSAAVSYRPDVVLLDLGLPVLSGIDVARELRRRPETAAARIVALTGWGQSDDVARTREAGFDHHLTKPADPLILRELLAQLAGGLS